MKLVSAVKKFWKDVVALRLPLAVIAIYLCATQLIFGYVCPSRILFHIECPGCGLTRGCLCVLTFQWKRAISYNPTSFAWVALILWLLYMRYFTDREKIHWEAPVIVVALITIVWKIFDYISLSL